MFELQNADCPRCFEDDGFRGDISLTPHGTGKLLFQVAVECDCGFTNTYTSSLE